GETAPEDDALDSKESIPENIPEDSTEIPPEVNTNEGKLRGTFLRTHQGKKIYAFLGIPYASPPTGSLRFMPPRPPTHWDGVKDATEEGPHCPQLTYPERKYEGSEDCLYLNVYTTRLPSVTSLETSQMDVVVVIHGGGFSHGSGDIAMYGPDYLLDHNVIMVTFNYRLGALGFLATGDEFAPGNYGLKDQIDALRWVRRNIPAFSGNPNSVTLLGAHSGAASVHYHMLSGLSRNLFHQGISQSGTALSPWAHVRAVTARERAFKLGELAGCKKKDLESTEELIKCIRKKPAELLVKESRKIMDYSIGFSYPFVPVEEEVVPDRSKPFLHDRPINIMKKPLPGLWEIPWLVSVTSHEGLPQSLQIMVYPQLMDGLNEEPENNVLKYLGLHVQPEEKAQQIALKIWNFYLQNDSLSYGNLVKLAEMTTDYNYYYGLLKSVKTLVAASGVPIFVYHFSYNRRDPRVSLGVPQGDDTQYIFPDIIAGKKLMTEEQHFHITERLLHIVTNFAHHGDPTPTETPVLNNIMWPLIEPDEFQYVDIGKKVTIKKAFYPERMAFWDHIFKMVDETTPVKDEL
ncbi:hypothetical protein ANN_04486, partial [Periplaneta americana]